MLRAAAVAAAVIALFTGAMYLRFSRDTNSVHIVVAQHPIAAGTRISDDMVKVVDVPDTNVPSGAFARTALVVGEVARVPLSEGEQVTATKLWSPPEALVLDEPFYSSNVSPVEGCRMPSGWRSGPLITDPIAQTLKQIRATNTCNQPDPSTAKKTLSTWDTAHEIVQARGASIIKTCEPGCSPDDHTKVWIVEVHGTVPPESAYGATMVPDSIQAEDTPQVAPVAGTWFSIIPVLNY